jgi:HAD superfamily hydrolase (TIGR01509 family)
VLTELTPHDTEALLFDWDGTLVDSQYANYRAMSRAMSHIGVDLEQEWFDARTGLSSAETIHTLVRERDQSLPVDVGEIVARRDAHFLQEAWRIQPHRPLLEVVEASYGRLRMAIASGGSRRIILATLRHLPFHDRFDGIVTRDDVAQGKPAPDIFLRAAADLNVEPARCTVYEDSDEGIAAAHAAGMRVIDVRPFTGRVVRTSTTP